MEDIIQLAMAQKEKIDAKKQQLAAATRRPNVLKGTNIMGGLGGIEFKEKFFTFTLNFNTLGKILTNNFNLFFSFQSIYPTILNNLEITDSIHENNVFAHDGIIFKDLSDFSQDSEYDMTGRTVIFAPDYPDEISYADAMHDVFSKRFGMYYPNGVVTVDKELAHAFIRKFNRAAEVKKMLQGGIYELTEAFCYGVFLTAGTFPNK